MDECKNCKHELQKVLTGNVVEYWHHHVLLKIGASMSDCDCGCTTPELQEGTQ